MQRLMMLLIFVVMVFVAFLIAAPLFIDEKKYQEELLLYIEKVTGLKPYQEGDENQELKVKIEGGLEVEFLPVPKIIAKSISVDNVKEASSSHIAHIESIVAKISFTDIFSGGFRVKEINFVRPVIEIEEFADGTNNWKDIIKSFQEREVSESDKFPDKVSINNATLSYVKDLQKTSLDYFTTDITADSFVGPYKMAGSFSSSDTVVKFKGGVDAFTDGAKVGMEIESEKAKITLEGQYKSGDEPKMVGDMKVSSQNIGHVLGVLFQSKSTFSKITSKEDVNVSGNFVFSKKRFMVENVLIESRSIQGTTDVSVDFNIGNDEENINWKVAADIDKIDLDYMLTADQDEKKVDESVVDYYAYSVNTTSISDFRFNLPKNLSLSLDIKIDDILYNQKISNVIAVMDLVDGHADVNNFSADLPGNSRAVLKGKIKHNGTRPMFEGEMEFGGSSFRDFIVWLDDYYAFVPDDLMREFLLTSKLRITPQQIDAMDILFSFDKSLFSGEFSVRPLKTIPIINLAISVDRMDFDKYNIDQQLYKELAHLTSGADDMILERTWLAKLKNKLNITFNAKDVVFNGQYIDNFSASGIVSKNKFSLQRLFLDSKDNKLKANFYADSSDGKTPEITFNFLAKELDTKLFIPQAEYNKDEKFKWSNKPLNFLGLSKFYGQYNVVINDFKHRNFYLPKLEIVANSPSKSKTGVLAFEKFEADFYGGTARVEGQMGISNKSQTVAVNLFLDGVELNPFLKVFKDDIRTTGQLFFVGSLSTKGKTLSHWVKNLAVKEATSAKISLQQVKFKGFDLSKILRESRRQFSFIDMMEIIKKASASGETVFDWLEGKIVLKDGLLSVNDFIVKHKLSKGLIDANLSLFSFDTRARAKILFEPERKRVVNIPISFKGNILDLDKKIDTKDLQIYITDKAAR